MQEEDKKKEDKKKVETMTFEEAVAQLEAILSKMDGGEVPLEESMANFEVGMKLIAHCETLLDSYERKITKLTATGEEAPLEV